jgi:hypothetical protein
MEVLDIMKRKIAALLMLPLLLSACGQTQNTETQPTLPADERERTVFQLSLSDEMKENIQSAYYDWYQETTGEEAVWAAWKWEDLDNGVIADQGCRYYGTFDDCIVWYANNESIAEAEYPVVSEGSFYVYRAGHHLSLQQAQKAGKISEEDISIVIARHISRETDFRSYGTYGACTVWYERANCLNSEQTTVADITFNDRFGGMIHVGREGQDYTLEQAYQEGFLTKANIQEIYEMHRQWDTSVFDVCYSLTDEQKTAIVLAYLNRMLGNQSPNILTEEQTWDHSSDQPGVYSSHGFRYYGLFEGWHIVFFVEEASDGIYETGEWNWGDICVKHPYWGDFFGYRNEDGKICFVTELYAKEGGLSENAVAVIAQRHREYNCAMYAQHAQNNGWYR